MVLTPLHSFAAPLLRYEIFDRAVVGGPCVCGRGLPVLTAILGRERNLLTLPNGRRVWPSFPSAAWTHVAPIRQIQMVQRSLQDIEVRCVVERDLEPAERDALSAALVGALGHPFRFAILRVDAIERGPSGKYEDFRSELGRPESVAR